MTEVKLHPLWEIADQKAGPTAQDPAVYQVGLETFMFVSKDGDQLNVSLDSRERLHVPDMLEVFHLYPDGHGHLSSKGGVRSAVGENIYQASFAEVDFDCKSGLGSNSRGFNWIRQQLDAFAEVLGDPNLRRVQPHNKSETYVEPELVEEKG